MIKFLKNIWLASLIILGGIGYAFYCHYSDYKLLTVNTEIVGGRFLGISKSGQAGRYAEYEYEIDGILYRGHTSTKKKESDIPNIVTVVYNVKSPNISCLVKCLDDNLPNCDYELGFWLRY